MEPYFIVNCESKANVPVTQQGYLGRQVAGKSIDLGYVLMLNVNNGKLSVLPPSVPNILLENNVPDCVLNMSQALGF